MAGRRYGIELDDGQVIEDPNWTSPADVMRSAHGQGVTRMPGRLVALTEEQVGWLPVRGERHLLAPAYEATARAEAAGMDQSLAGLSEADVERACNGPLVWEGDQA